MFLRDVQFKSSSEINLAVVIESNDFFQHCPMLPTSSQTLSNTSNLENLFKIGMKQFEFLRKNSAIKNNDSNVSKENFSDDWFCYELRAKSFYYFQVLSGIPPYLE